MELDLVTFITNNGFAIAVAVYSLTRLEKTVSANTKVLQTIAGKLGVKP